MKKLLLALGTLAMLFSCQQTRYYFKPDNLLSQKILIYTNRDTAITLQGGTRLSIPAHAFTRDSVALVIKEALTVVDMINGGLETRSKGKILGSGGMIYINADSVKMLKPIHVTVPAEYVDERMQLFKGNGTEWEDPSTLQFSKKDTTPVVRGKALYQRECASCHLVDDTLTAPPLLGAIERWGRDTTGMWEYLHMGENYDRYTCCLEKVYKKDMPSFRYISQDDVKDILSFVNDEGLKKYGGVPAAFKAKNECDSCMYYERQEDSLSVAFTTNNIYVPDYNSDTATDSAADYFDVGDYETPVTPVPNQPAREIISNQYSFDIYSFGWYNIDRYIDEAGSVLKVKLTGAIKNNFQIILAIPADKVILTGFISKDHYVFKHENGTLPLPLNKQCYIFAIGEKDTIPLFGMTSFLSSSSQTVTVTLQPSTKKAIADGILSIGYPENVYKNRRALYLNSISESRALQIQKELREYKGPCQCTVPL